MANSMAISPQVQNYGQETGPEQEEQLFKLRFNQMAYAALAAKFAEIMQYIITFKILETDLDNSFAIGVFILDYQGKAVYIPVILNDGLLKPLDIIYYKDLNAFLPLNLMWLDEISKMTIDDMGVESDLPKGLQQNVNVRGLVIPPTTVGGREGYASVDPTPYLLFKEAEIQDFKSESNTFLKIIEQSPVEVVKGIKLAFNKHPTFLKKCAEIYGIDSLITAFNKTEKTAEQVKKGTLTVLTPETPEEQIISVFGNKAGEAFSTILKEGYVISDTRVNIKNAAVKIEHPVFLDTPGPSPSWYRLYFTDSPPDEFFIIPFPKNIGELTCRPCEPYTYGSKHVIINYMVISKDGKLAWVTNKVVGERIEKETPSIKKSKIYSILNGGAGDTPKVYSKGFFINPINKLIEVTTPTKIEAVYSNKGRTKYMCEYGTPYILDSKPIHRTITGANDAVYLPKGTVFVEMYKDKPIGDYDVDRVRRDKNRLKQHRSSIIDDPKMLYHWFDYVMNNTDAQKPKVKTAGLNQWWLAGLNTPINTSTALYKLAIVHDISINDAECILEDARKLGSASIYIIPKNSYEDIRIALNKYAQVPQELPLDYQSNPGQQQNLPMIGDSLQMSPALGTEMLPSQLGNQLNEMGAQGSPPINPTDLAIGEAVQDLQVQSQQQMTAMQSQMANMQAQLDSQQQNTEQLINVLQGIQQRSSEIAQVTGGSIPDNALASPSVAAKALAPIPPASTEPAPMPMMTQDGFLPELIAEQINPALAEQAAAFNDAGMFDTAAVGMLASSPILQDVVATYVPNLEKAVDNLGRILLTLWMKEDETKEAIGEEAFISLEDKLRTVFKNLGEVVLSLSKNAVNASEEAEKAQMVMQAKQG